MAKEAIALNQYLIAHYWDDEKGGFFFTSDKGEELITRTKEIYDGAVPSGNSVAMLNLLRLSRITAKQNLKRKRNKLLKLFRKTLSPFLRLIQC